MRLPSFHVYCDNTTGHNALCFDLGYVTVWYSYRTVVAFRTAGAATTVRENSWGPTTGKHLNAIDGGTREAKTARLPASDFEDALRVAVYGPRVPN